MTAADNSRGIQPPRIHPGDIINEDDIFSFENNDIDAAYFPWLQSIDIILLLGGGVPLSPAEPPVYVQRRCDAVARFVHHRIHDCSNPRGEEKEKGNVSVICLSAGTAHLPQYVLPHTGLPLWESTASAAYLLRHPTHPVPANNVFVETTSYDTISNAFFARTVMTDIMRQGNDDSCSSENTRLRRRDKPPPPQRVLVVTNEFHVGRSKAIFDWIFGAPLSTMEEFEDEHRRHYEMFYLSCNNVGLPVEAIHARKEHERRGEIHVRTKLSVQYKTLHHVWMFLTKEHDFYSASKLVERAMVTSSSTSTSTSTSPASSSSSSSVLKLSYGKAPTASSSSTSSREDEEGRTTTSQIVDYRKGKIVLTLDALSIIGVVIASLLYSCARKKQ